VAEQGKLVDLANRVLKGAPEKAAATEMRIARVKPGEKTYKTGKEETLRKQQIKGFQTYETEIATDAAERAARREAQVPKTEAGKISLQGRIQVAEKNLPRAREDYYKSAGRVRALEDQVVKASGPEKSRYEQILESAKNDLKDAEFALEQTLNNAKTGQTRVGLDEMRKAAQNKMLEIADKVAAGEEVKLLKRDYNPEFVKQAKALSKKKPLPGQEGIDYFTQVHSEYANEYRKQLARIEDEIKNLPHSMSGAQQRGVIQKQKDILNKLIDHIEAENLIHRRKLALRGMAERQKADQRFRQLTSKKEGGKVPEATRSAIKEAGERAEAIKTVEGRQKIANEIVENISAKHEGTKFSQDIQKEKSQLIEALEEVHPESRKAVDAIKDAPHAKTEKEAIAKVNSSIKNFRRAIDSMLKKIPIIGKFEPVREAILGMATSAFGELAKEADFPVGYSTLAAGMIGRPQTAFFRSLGNALGKWVIRSWKKNKIEKAYRQRDHEKISEYKKKYSHNLMKEAREESFSRSA
jgi:hypothetical protein